MISYSKIKSDTEEEVFLTKALLGYIIQNNNTSIIGQLFVSVFIYLLLQESIQYFIILPWLLYMFSAALFRFVAGNIAKKQLDKTNQATHGYFLLASLLSMAAGWGFAGIQFLQPDSIANNSYLVLAITGVIAGAIATTSYLYRYYVLFLLLSISPLVLHLSIQGDRESLLFAGLVTFFGIYMLKIAKLYQTQIINNLKLNLHNEHLITELKQQNNEIISASHLKNRFLANMSHELRTPINSTLGFIHLLQQKETDEVKVNYLSIIYNSSKELLNKIDNILSFSNLEEEQIVISRKPEYIKTVLGTVIKQNQPLLNRKKIKVNISISPSLTEKIEIDAFKLQQIIDALLSNAIKFSKNTQEINVFANYQPSSKSLSISVEDFGKGISSDKLDYILLPFTQEDLSDKRLHDGQGLGLTIASKLVKLLGGTLTIQSELNKGSRFELTIPATTSKLKTTNKKLTGHVLIVEDNATSQLLISKLVQSIGLEYTIAKNGLEGVEKFKEHSFDLILMDENMPKMTGIEATTEIRKLEKGKNITIIAITANTLKEDEERFLQAGMDHYLKKPLDIDKFYDLLRTTLKTHAEKSK